MRQLQTAIFPWDSGQEHEVGIQGERMKYSANNSITYHLFDMVGSVPNQAKCASLL